MVARKAKPSRLDVVLGGASPIPWDLAGEFCDRLRVPVGATAVRAEVHRILVESRDRVATVRALRTLATSFGEHLAVKVGGMALRDDRARRPSPDVALASIEALFAAKNAEAAQGRTAAVVELSDREAAMLDDLTARGSRASEDLRESLNWSPKTVVAVRRELIAKRLAKPRTAKHGLCITPLGRLSLRHWKSTD